MNLCDPGKGQGLHHVTRISHVVLDRIVLFGRSVMHLSQPLLS